MPRRRRCLRPLASSLSCSFRFRLRSPAEDTEDPIFTPCGVQTQFSKEPRAIILAIYHAIYFVRIGERAIILKTGGLKTFATELASAS